MTGESIPTKENWSRLKPYYKNLISLVLIVSGAALIIEHIFKYNGTDMLDFAGHEYYGLAMIIIGFLLSMKWGQWKELKLSNIRNWIR